MSLPPEVFHYCPHPHLPTLWPYVNSVLHISQNNGGGRRAAAWHWGELLPEHFNNQRGYGLPFDFFLFFNKEKKIFLQSGKRELRDQP